MNEKEITIRKLKDKSCQHCDFRSMNYCIKNNEDFEKGTCEDWIERDEIDGWTMPEILAREG